MKSAIKKYWLRIQGWNGLILMVYFLAVCAADILISEFYSTDYLALSLCYIFLLTILFSPIIIRCLSNLRIHNLAGKQAANRCCFLALQAAFYLIPLAVFLLYYVAFYPGGFSPDSITQYSQAITNTYTDWHPAIHTLFAFKLPLTLSGGWVGSVVLLQVICFSAALGYAFQTVYKYTNIKFTLVSMAFVLLNPLTGSMAMMPWKDISFAIGALLFLTYSLQIYRTNGSWIKSPVNTVLYIITAVLTTLFRHNALLFTIPLIFAVLFYLSPKRSLVLCLSVLILCLGMKGPLYNAINVQSPPNRQVEKLGLPMTVIGAVVTYSPEALDAETREFAYKVAPKEVWETKYQYGTYNQVKWSSDTDNLVIEEYGTAKILSMTARAFIRSPRIATTAFLSLVKASFSLTSKFNSFFSPYVNANTYGISQDDGGLARKICVTHRNFVSGYISYPFLHLGFWHLVLIAAILAKCNLKKFKDWKKIFFVLPVFAYNYGTSLMLTGAEDSTRFFFYTYLLIPILLIFLFGNDAEKDKEISL